MPRVERIKRELVGPKVWYQQPDETAKAYEAFKSYADLGSGRTVLEAARKLTGKARIPSWWYDWSYTWSWDERIRAKEAYYQAEIDRAEIQARIDARHLRRQVSSALMSTGLIGLQRHRERLEEVANLPKNASKAELAKALAPLREYVQAVRDGAEQNRKDWNEEPVQRVQQAAAIQTVVKIAASDLDSLDAKTLIDAFKQLDDDPRAALELVKTDDKETT